MATCPELGKWRRRAAALRSGSEPGERETDAREAPGHPYETSVSGTYDAPGVSLGPQRGDAESGVSQCWHCGAWVSRAGMTPLDVATCCSRPACRAAEADYLARLPQ